MSAHAVAYDYESGPAIERGRLGVWLFVGSELMFFAGLFSAWFVLRAGAADWPAEPRVSLGLGLGFTAVLALASLAAAAAVRAARRGARGATARWLFFTGLLGLGFLGGQVYEYQHLLAAGSWPRTDVAWGLFYALTAAHGLHVAVGVLWNFGLWVQAWRGRIPAWRARRVEYAAFYQHFVDVVWLGVFTALYVVG